MGLDAFLKKIKNDSEKYVECLNRRNFVPPYVSCDTSMSVNNDTVFPEKNPDDIRDYFNNALVICKHRDYILLLLNKIREWQNRISQANFTVKNFTIPDIDARFLIDVINELLNLTSSEQFYENFKLSLRVIYEDFNKSYVNNLSDLLNGFSVEHIEQNNDFTGNIRKLKEQLADLNNCANALDAASVKHESGKFKVMHEEVTSIFNAIKNEKITDVLFILKQLNVINNFCNHCANISEGYLYKFWALFPNVPHDSVPHGVNESENTEISKVGNIKKTDFTPKSHEDLGVNLNIIDFKQAAVISGSRSVILHDQAAILEKALSQLMIDNAMKRGYKLVSPPYLGLRGTFFNVGQLDKFYDDLYLTSGMHECRNITEEDYRKYYREASPGLITTAEVVLTNLVADKLLRHDDLPLRYVACTPCFRREAGSAGRDTKGMIRMHQFIKVELVTVSSPEKSYEEHEFLTGTAELVLEALELPYRKMLLCTGDMGFASSKTYDLEVWLPSQNCYREISSCSNCEDFQAIRMNARYKDRADKKNKHVHTLNGSALAVGRTLIALMENYQNSDGSITIPDVLRNYVDFDIIRQQA